MDLRLTDERYSKTRDGVFVCESRQQSRSSIIWGPPLRIWRILISREILTFLTGFRILRTTGLSVIESMPSYTSEYFPLPRVRLISNCSQELLNLPEIDSGVFVVWVFFFLSGAVIAVFLDYVFAWLVGFHLQIFLWNLGLREFKRGEFLVCKLSIIWKLIALNRDKIEFCKYLNYYSTKLLLLT